MKTYQQHLQEAITYHGHLCAGQIIGVRMARMALKILGIDEPAGFRDLIVYVECDRCLTDAIGVVTGCKLGKRNLKCMDYGKSAATFLNLQDGKAIRVYRKMRAHIPDGTDLTSFFDSTSDEELFSTAHVNVHYRPEDLPCKPLYAMTCPLCDEEVIDGRQVMQNGTLVCKACAGSAYYDVEGRQ